VEGIGDSEGQGAIPSAVEAIFERNNFVISRAWQCIAHTGFQFFLRIVVPPCKLSVFPEECYLHCVFIGPTAAATTVEEEIHVFVVRNASLYLRYEFGEVGGWIDSERLPEVYSIVESALLYFYMHAWMVVSDGIRCNIALHVQDLVSVAIH